MRQFVAKITLCCRNRHTNNQSKTETPHQKNRAALCDKLSWIFVPLLFLTAHLSFLVGIGQPRFTGASDDEYYAFDLCISR